MKPLTLARLEALTCAPDGRDKLTTFAGGISVRAYKGAEKPGKLTNKTFWARYSHGGKKYGVKIGRCDVVSIADALKAAKAIQGDVAKGGNPAAERKAAKQAAERRQDALTVETLLDRWNSIGLAGARDRHRYEAMRALKRSFEGRLSHPAAALTKAAVVETLDQLTEAGAPIMASRVMQYGRAAYAWAMKRGMLEANPFVGVPTAAAAKRDRVLDDDELGRVLRAADPTVTFGGLVWLLALTGARRGEIAGMTRSELSHDGAMWTLPAPRAKNGHANDVPLSAPARHIIASRLLGASGGASLLFAGPQGRPYNDFHNAKRRLEQISGVTGWTLHDLRRTVATNLQKIGVRLEVTESILNHIGGSRGGITGIYQRYSWDDEKRAALDGWAAKLTAVVEGREAPSNVTPIRA
jgi:integrase